MGIQHILWTTAEADANCEVKSNFVFTIPNNFSTAVVAEERSRALPMIVSRKIAERVRARSFEGSRVWHGSSPWSAGFDVRLAGFEVIFMVSARGSKRKIIQGHGTTWCSRPVWRYPLPKDVSQGWEQVCVVIEEILKDDLQATSVRRLIEAPDVEHENAALPSA
jgi:hypothetical protein